MKKNNNGFALAEILAVTLVMMAIFAILYGNFMPLAGEYDKSISYNDVSSQYTLHYFRKLYMNNVTLNSNEEYRLLNCSESKNQSKCSSLLELNKYVEPDNPETELSPKILLTKYNLTNIKTITSGEYENIPEPLREFSTYINNLPNYKDKDTEEETYRLIIKTQTGYANTELNGITISTPAINATELLKSKVGTDGINQIIHPADSTLQIGATTAITEYRYQGANADVKNYVTFNNETWRIMGVFPTDNGAGVIQERVKIILDSTIYSSAVYGSEEGNDWNNSSLKTYLNTTYFNSLTDANLVDSVKYYLGSDSYNTTINAYLGERKISGSNYYLSGNGTNWTGKIGLMYASDYGYGSASCVANNTTLSQYSSCNATNWLYGPHASAMITPYGGYSEYITHVLYDGNVHIGWGGNVRPVLYLKPEVKITGGTGVPEDAYQLSL